MHAALRRASGRDVGSGCALIGAGVADAGPVLGRCIRRALRWRLPPNWSPADWGDEVHAAANAAAWQARRDFDPGFGVPWVAFLYLRVLRALRDQYRREWRFARHNQALNEQDDNPAPEPAGDAAALADLRSDLASLPDDDRTLLVRLFWQGQTQSEIARDLGVSQQTISHRKRLIVEGLRHRSPRPDTSW